LSERTTEGPPKIGRSGRIRVARRTRSWWRSKERRTELWERVRPVLFWILVVYAAAVAVSLLTVMPSAWRAANEGRASLIDGRDALLARNDKAALTAFRKGRDVLDGTSARISSVLSWPLRILPVASTHVRVADSLAGAGARVADIGVDVSEAINELPERELQLIDGQVDLSAVRRMSALLRSRVGDVAEIGESIRRMPSGWVVGPLAEARREGLELLPDAVGAMQKATVAAEALPGLLGADEPKRYLIAFSSLSELRGTGGLYGYVTELDASDGDLDLADTSGDPVNLFPPPGVVGLPYPEWFSEEFKRNSGIFLNINLTTDFPTVGRFIVETASFSLGDVDGVIAVDPLAIGALLHATGPITVPTWNGEITAGNVSKIAHHDVYVQIANKDTRDDFYEQLVRTTFDRLTSGDIRISPRSAGALDAAVRGGNLRMYSRHATDQQAIEDLGMSGSVEHPQATDVLSVVSENASGNKIDWFLRRDILYRVRLDPERGTGRGELVATFRNDAPSEGLPDYVIGSPTAIARGSNQSLLLLLRGPPDSLEHLEIGHTRDPVVLREREGRLRSYRSSLSIPSGAGVVVRSTSAIPGAVRKDGDVRRYRLEVVPQAMANADHGEIVIESPPGWSVKGGTRFSGPLNRPVTLEIEMTRTARATLLDEVILDPARAIGRFLGRLF
jgi:hypothetical protein